MGQKKWNAEKIYINEIIRITYKCNWKCKFCNVLETNNYWEKDVSDKEVIYKILNLTRKYTKSELKNLVLSFSWWEPTLNKNLIMYIKLAKNIWVWVIEVQTNGTVLFNNKEYIVDLYNAWLDEIFLAQHSDSDIINAAIWSKYSIKKFEEWVNFIVENEIHNKVNIYLNIVVTKINIFWLYNFIKHLINIGFVKMIPLRHHDNWKTTTKISFWFVQPNWYANLNKEEVLLTYTEDEIWEIDRVIDLCKKNNILPDFHFVCPPICILNYPEYNLEYDRLKKLERNQVDWEVNKANLESYKFLWKEKMKFWECRECNYEKYCLWFYKNWIDFVWENYVKGKIQAFVVKSKGTQ